MNIENYIEQIFECSINKSYNLSYFKPVGIKLDIDIEKDKDIIRSCAISAWDIEESQKDKIKYVFVTYHSKIVGIFEVEDIVAKNDVINKFKLDCDEVDDGKYIYPSYPPKRSLEYAYLKALKGCKTEEDAKKALTQEGKDENKLKLSYQTLTKKLLGRQNFEDWLNTYLFKFKDTAIIPKDLEDYLGKTLPKILKEKRKQRRKSK